MDMHINRKMDKTKCERKQSLLRREVNREIRKKRDGSKPNINFANGQHALFFVAVCTGDAAGDNTYGVKSFHVYLHPDVFEHLPFLSVKHSVEHCFRHLSTSESVLIMNRFFLPNESLHLQKSKHFFDKSIMVYSISLC